MVRLTQYVPDCITEHMAVETNITPANGYSFKWFRKQQLTSSAKLFSFHPINQHHIFNISLQEGYLTEIQTYFLFDILLYELIMYPGSMVIFHSLRKAKLTQWL